LAYIRLQFFTPQLRATSPTKAKTAILRYVWIEWPLGDAPNTTGWTWNLRNGIVV